MFFFITLPLTPPIRTLLQRQCCGLKPATWVEEADLFIQLQKIEVKDQGQLVEIQERLREIDLPPFSVSLDGIHATFRKKGEGVLWAGVVVQPALQILAKSVLKSLKEFEPSNEPPHITLGWFHPHSAERVATYLEAHASFISPVFLVSAFDLIECHKTAKRIIYTRLERFSLRA